MYMQDSFDSSTSPLPEGRIAHSSGSCVESPTSWWEQHLPPLDARYIRAFGAMVEPLDAVAIGMFSVSLLQDVRELFDKVPYWGDEGVPRLFYDRGTYVDNHNLHTRMSSAMALQHTPTGLNLEGAFMIAAERHAQIVPESRECLKYAAWAACTAVRNTRHWKQRKQRIGSKGARSHLDHALRMITSRQWTLTQDSHCKYLFFYRTSVSATMEA